MTVAKDQHILPQMYLKHFVDPDTPPAMEPYVWLYDLAKHRWQRRAPRNVAKKRYYYAFQNKNKQLVNTLEPLLSAIESSGATLIRKLTSQTPLTVREQEDFSLFIAQLTFRTPQSRAATASSLDRKCEEFVTETIQRWRENPKEFAAEFAALPHRYYDESGKCVDISIDEVEKSKPKVVPRDGAILGYSMLPTIGLAARLLMMSWRIFFTQAEHWLVSCDQPCELEWPDDITEETFQGFFNKGIEFHVPLTPNMLFAAFDDGSNRAFGEFLPDRIVIELNQRMVSRADQFIVSPKPSFLGDDVLVASA